MAPEIVVLIEQAKAIVGTITQARAQMGRVYRAMKNALGETVAVKYLKKAVPHAPRLLGHAITAAAMNAMVALAEEFDAAHRFISPDGKHGFALADLEGVLGLELPDVERVANLTTAGELNHMMVESLIAKVRDNPKTRKASADKLMRHVSRKEGHEIAAPDSKAGLVAARIAAIKKLETARKRVLTLEQEVSDLTARIEAFDAPDPKVTTKNRVTRPRVGKGRGKNRNGQAQLTA